jgi:hypothetical protein
MRSLRIVFTSLVLTVTGPLAISRPHTWQPELVPACVTPTIQNTKDQTRKSEDEAVEQEIQQAIQLINQALVSVKELPDPVSRIRSYMSLAETLWEFEPVRARDLIRQAWSEVERMLGEKKTVVPPRTPMVSQRSPTLLRREILKRTAALDSALAAELARRVPEPAEEAEKSPQPSPSEKAADLSTRAEQLLTLAMTLITNEPKRAAALAVESLTAGVTPSLVFLMSEWRKQNRALADELYQQALPVAVRQARRDPRGLFLLGSYVIPGLPLPMRFLPDGEPPPVDPAQAEHYLGLLINLLAFPEESSTGDNANRGWPDPASRHSLLTQLAPAVARYAPDTVTVLEVAQQQLATRLAQQGQKPLELPKLTDEPEPKERIDELIAQAEKAQSEEERTTLYFRAIDLAVTHKLVDRARTLLTRIGDLTLRSELSDYIAYSAALDAAEHNDVEQAKIRAAECAQPERLALAFIAITRKLNRSQDCDALIQVLSEAALRIQRLPTSSHKARALVRLADAMLPLDAPPAYDLLAVAIPVFNASEAPLEALDSVSFHFKVKGRQKAVRLGQHDLTAAIEMLMRSMGQHDVNQALLLSAQWTSLDLRILAQVAAAKGIFDHIKQKSQGKGRSTKGN